MSSTPWTATLQMTTQEAQLQHGDPFHSGKGTAKGISYRDIHSYCSVKEISGSIQSYRSIICSQSYKVVVIYSQLNLDKLSKKHSICKTHTFWLGILGERNRRVLLCHNQSVFPHAFYSWFLPFRFSFLSSLFFWLFVHCLTDGFGTMLWQQLVDEKNSPPS